MPKVKSVKHYGKRHCLYGTTTTSEEKSKYTNNKIRILSPAELNERYQNAVICEGVKNIQINK